MILPCQYCGQPFRCSASRAVTRHFCSHACANAALHKPKMFTAIRHWCPVCGDFARPQEATRCTCGAKADNRFAAVEVDVEPEEVAQ